MLWYDMLARYKLDENVHPRLANIALEVCISFVFYALWKYVYAYFFYLFHQFYKILTFFYYLKAYLPLAPSKSKKGVKCQFYLKID